MLPLKSYRFAASVEIVMILLSLQTVARRVGEHHIGGLPRLEVQSGRLFEVKGHRHFRNLDSTQQLGSVTNHRNFVSCISLLDSRSWVVRAEVRCGNAEMQGSCPTAGPQVKRTSCRITFPERRQCPTD